MKNKIALFIPCYNEEPRLNIDAIWFFIEENRNCIDFIFVDDGSSDDTSRIIEERLVNNVDTFLISLSENTGKGNALRKAILMNLGKPYQYYGFIDADLDIPFDQINQLYNHLVNSKFLVAVSSRNIVSNISLLRLRSVSSLLMVLFANTIIGFKPRLRDTQCGCKLFHRDVVANCFKEEFISGWLFDIEVFLRLKNSLEKPRDIICEVSLNDIESSQGSRFEFRKNLKIIKELYQIKNHYK